MASDFKMSYQQDALARFRSIMALGDGALRRLSGEEMFRSLDDEANSVALIVKHMAGNESKCAEEPDASDYGSMGELRSCPLCVDGLRPQTNFRGPVKSGTSVCSRRFSPG